MIFRYRNRLHRYFFVFVILLNGCIPSQISHKAALGGQIDITYSIPRGKLLILKESVQILFDRTEEAILHFQKFYVKCKIMESSPSEDIALNSFSSENDSEYNDMAGDLEFRKNALRILQKYTLMLCAVSAGELDSDIDKSLVELEACIHHLNSLPCPREHISGNYADLFRESMQVIRRIDSVQTRAGILKTVMNLSQQDVYRLVSLITDNYEKHVSYLNRISEKMLVSLNQKRPVHEDYYDPLLTVFDTEAAGMIDDYKSIRSYLKLLTDALSVIPGVHLSLADILAKKNGDVPELQKLVLHIQEIEYVKKKISNLTPKG